MSLRMRRYDRGVTLIELMVALAVIAIIAAFAVPSFLEFRERSVVKGAAEEVVNRIADFRFEAVRRNRRLNLSFGGTPDTDSWCVGAIVGDVACDCTASPNTCAVGVFPSDGAATLRGARLTVVTGFGTGSSFVFDPSTGTLVDPADAGSITIGSPTARFGYSLRVDVNALGRVDVCVPAGGNQIPGYPSC